MKLLIALLVLAGAPHTYKLDLPQPAPSPQAWLQEAAAAHRAADDAVARGDVATARRVLEDFPEQHVPANGMKTEDVVHVMQDILFHLASIDLAASNVSAARADASQGIEMKVGDDLFTANLLVIRGRACELLKDDRGAVSDYQEALHINEALLHGETEKSP